MQNLREKKKEIEKREIVVKYEIKDKSITNTKCAYLQLLVIRIRIPAILVNCNEKCADATNSVL